MGIHFKVAHGKSDIYIERNIRKKILKYANLDRRVLVLCDDGIPYEYVETIRKQCGIPFVKIIPHGEKSKSLDMVEQLCAFLYGAGFDKNDLIFAVGGGVIGDLAGFIASIYLGGIEVISLPTTTLSQIDSSIGGKTAVNFKGTKNLVGSFYQPSKVFIDLNTLSTLTRRQYYSGIIEALKAGMIRDPDLYSLFVKNKVDFLEEVPPEDLEEVIERALYVKRDVVEEDEKELGIRKILNFGHTIGHAIEGLYMGKYYHGECVGLGMLMVLENKELRNQLREILKKMDMPVQVECSVEELMPYLVKDKKFDGKMMSLVQVDEIGKGYIKEVDINWIENHIRNYLEEQV